MVRRVFVSMAAFAALGFAPSAYAQVDDWSQVYEQAFTYWDFSAGDVSGAISVVAFRSGDTGRISLHVEWGRCDPVTHEETYVTAHSLRLVEPDLVWFAPFMTKATARGRADLTGYVGRYPDCSGNTTATSYTNFKNLPFKVIAKWAGPRGHDVGPMLAGDDPLSCMLVGVHADQGPQPLWNGVSATVQLEGSLPEVGDLTGTYAGSTSTLQRYLRVAVHTGSNYDCVS